MRLVQGRGPSACHRSERFFPKRRRFRCLAPVGTRQGRPALYPRGCRRAYRIQSFRRRMRHSRTCAVTRVRMVFSSNRKGSAERIVTCAMTSENSTSCASERAATLVAWAGVTLRRATVMPRNNERMIERIFGLRGQKTSHADYSAINKDVCLFFWTPGKGNL